MKKLYIIDTILLIGVLVVFIYYFKLLNQFILLYYILVLTIYIYINIVLKNILIIPLNRGNYWTYVGIPFILFGKVYFMSLIQSSAENVILFNGLLTIILIIQVVIPSFNLLITSYITNDGKVLYLGIKLYNFENIVNYETFKHTLGVNVLIGYLKSGKSLYMVFSDQNLNSFISYFDESKKQFNWHSYLDNIENTKVDEDNE